MQENSSSPRITTEFQARVILALSHTQFSRDFVQTAHPILLTIQRISRLLLHPPCYAGSIVQLFQFRVKSATWSSDDTLQTLAMLRDTIDLRFLLRSLEHKNGFQTERDCPIVKQESVANCVSRLSNMLLCKLKAEDSPFSAEINCPLPCRLAPAC